MRSICEFFVKFLTVQVAPELLLESLAECWANGCIWETVLAVGLGGRSAPADEFW